MRHIKGDCPNADPNSDELCPICHACEDAECVKEIGHQGFHVAKEDLEPMKPETTWEEEWREYFTKCLKPKKPTIGNLDLELSVNFIRTLLSDQRRELAGLIQVRIDLLTHGGGPISNLPQLQKGEVAAFMSVLEILKDLK